MRITQGTFSFLPDFTDEQIEAQMRYAVSNGWSLSIEYTDEPHPRNALLGDVGPAALRPTVDGIETVMREVRACREAFPEAYIKVIAYDATYGRQTTRAELHRQPPVGRARLPARADEDRDRVIRYRHGPQARGSRQRRVEQRADARRRPATNGA